MIVATRSLRLFLNYRRRNLRFPPSLLLSSRAEGFDLSYSVFCEKVWPSLAGEVPDLLVRQPRMDLACGVRMSSTAHDCGIGLGYWKFAYRDEHESPMEESEVEHVYDSKSISPLVEEKDACQLDELRELLQKVSKELQAARLSSAMFEEKALKVSEIAIALKDEAEPTQDDVNSALSIIQDIITGEDIAKEAVREATTALSMAEARHQLALGSIDSHLEQRISTGLSGNSNNKQAHLSAEEEIRSCKEILESCNESLNTYSNKESGTAERSRQVT
ncbi:hypothetical protein ZIOFF_034496 [Zingiber officinale]|uniref:Uncharacterized protein n=1 Tax=Zingiber officinale TaxID=94328 RepID=A0A8J5L8G6_ZINOF|nr:hypothetical protein ZIOFF_034496 [Zingiber officinale]